MATNDPTRGTSGAGADLGSGPGLAKSGVREPYWDSSGDNRNRDDDR